MRNAQREIDQFEKARSSGSRENPRIAVASLFVPIYDLELVNALIAEGRVWVAGVKPLLDSLYEMLVFRLAHSIPRLSRLDLTVAYSPPCGRGASLSSRNQLQSNKAASDEHKRNEGLTPNQRVHGSSPCAPTIESNSYRRHGPPSFWQRTRNGTQRGAFLALSGSFAAAWTTVPCRRHVATEYGESRVRRANAREPRFSPPISKAISPGSRCPETRNLRDVTAAVFIGCRRETGCQ
jgi:hypothetical protein